MLDLVSVKANVRPNMFTDLCGADFPLPVLEGLTKLYRAPHKDLRIIGGLINHCFTARTDMVMVSRPILQDVVDQDPNIKDKFTVSSAIYKGLTGYLAKGILLEQRMHSCKRAKGVRGMAAVYELSQPMKAYLALTQEEADAVEECVALLNKLR